LLKVTVVHRRGSFRASHALAAKVLAHPKITVLWHASVARFVGDDASGLRAVELTYAAGAEGGSGSRPKTVACKAAFVAVGHDPISSFLVGSGVAIGDGG
jgi:thioredoxin reductase (NADPH)